MYLLNAALLIIAIESVQGSHLTANQPLSTYGMTKNLCLQTLRAVAIPTTTVFGYIGSKSNANGVEMPTSSDLTGGFGGGMPLGESAYAKLGKNLRICKVTNGMWQVSGAHGFQPVKDNVIKEMSRCAEAGFTSFDLADIYGPAEDYVGAFSKGPMASSLSKDCQFFTKWVPRPQEVDRAIGK